MAKYFIILFAATFLFSCKKEEQKSDAYGNFESRSTTVSAKARGQLIFLNIQEGKNYSSGELVALVDTTQLHLQRRLLYSQLNTVSSKTINPDPDIAVFQKQIANLSREKNRVEKLVAAKAATSQQLDDIVGQIIVIEQQIEASKSKAKSLNRGILSEKDPIGAQIKLIDQQIKDCYIYNPIAGTVIKKLSEPTEVVNFGTPVYTIADMSILTLRAYSEANKMQELKINQEVTVLVDEGTEQLRTVKGKLTWISQEAEFTPKTIQTREERINLVYAVKIDVRNDGRLKIGMPAEVMFEAGYSPTLRYEK